LEALSDLGLNHVPVLRIGICDHFVEHGKAKELRMLLKLDADGIYQQVKEWLQKVSEGKVTDALYEHGFQATKKLHGE
jgi:deoxyxylulose-5-phosphate synthase